jgi:hypothetical protein
MRSHYLILAFILMFETVIEVLGAWKPFPGNASRAQSSSTGASSTTT